MCDHTPSNSPCDYHVTYVGVEDSEGWSKHKIKEGVAYFHNCRTGNSQWEEPEEFCGQSRELSREEIQVSACRVWGWGGLSGLHCWSIEETHVTRE